MVGLGSIFRAWLWADTRLGDEAFAMALLKTAIVFHQFPWIVSHRFRNPVSRLAHGINGWVFFFHGDSFSPSSSKGVTNVGTNSPRIPLTRRMWANLLALAKCWQFHVSRKSHL